MTEKQNKLEQHFERYQSILKDLTLMSDVLMRNAGREHTETGRRLRLTTGQLRHLYYRRRCCK